ncbi:MAG TPA: zf-HC2 domain-containing protein [Vicinamibacterales bacterium]|jgi:anti-sigma factor RsiW|nr:zf-HC2 domain-containing protein [Vicinamibacterales bacterium]
MAEEIRNCRDVEARLTPYVDGESASDLRHAIDAHLAACPPCREEAAAERGGRDVIREHREVLRAAAPEALRDRCAAHARPPMVSRTLLRRWVPLSLAATLLLAAAGATIFSITNPTEALAAGFALDHMKCFRVCDTDHPMDASAAESMWRQVEGWQIAVPPSEPAERLQLVNIRRCLSTDGLAAHLLYRWRGEPLSLYVLPRAIDGDHVVDSLGHETAVWTADGRTYALVTPGHPDDFDSVVHYVKTHAR